MAAKEVKGRVTSFRRGNHVVHDYVTIVELEGGVDRDALIGAKVVWKREDGLQILGRVQSRHGNHQAVQVRWKTGFPPQGVGDHVTIRPK